ncbi:hypothetical protein T4A_4872 [Trichinella pseudospiralis]|uniref:Uncharacterized protein n=1 Tax=Trichinella pseudospiralis TaxID=6337 RepID=A0A0V1DTG6_TRIPS|nr:hypothetical protein T4A_4872 [Trichinella pseudospiralis]
MSSMSFRSKHRPLCTYWTSKPNYTHNYAGDLYATHIRERLAKPVPIFQQQLCTNFVLQSGLHLPQLQLWTVFYLYKQSTRFVNPGYVSSQWLPAILGLTDFVLSDGVCKTFFSHLTFIT